jgi:hypothetical protein
MRYPPGITEERERERERHTTEAMLLVLGRPVYEDKVWTRCLKV